MATKLQHWTLQSLGEALAVHIAGTAESDEKLLRLFETVVTGNGHEPMTQTVSRNTEWINSVKRFGWILITSIAGMLVAGATSLIYMVVRIYPLLEQIQKLERIK